MGRFRFHSWAAAAVILLTGAGANAGDRLDAIKGRGKLICGVSFTDYGFSAPDSAGTYRGLDVDVCRRRRDPRRRQQG